MRIVIDIDDKLYNRIKYLEPRANTMLDELMRSVQNGTPQPKMGRWLEKEVNSDKVIEEWQSARCSVCDKYHTTPYMYYFSHYNYCPSCGAQMEVEE